MAHIVVYRPHYEANMFTKFYGPFADFDSAYEFLGTLPALGVYEADCEAAKTGFTQSGVKYIADLESVE